MEVYFDNSATTRCYDSVKDIVVKTMTEDFGNPSAMHLKGVDAEKYVKESAKTIASILKVQEKEILFTSGGTESDNLALIGGALANKRNGNHIIITSVEHAAVSQPASFSQEQTLSTIHRDAQTRYITVSGAVDENHNVTLLSDKIKSKINKLSIPDGYSIDMEGEDETINESMSQLGLMLVLAVIFIYLIMVAQFQSLLSPFIIMFCIPLAFTGGFIALFITGNELGIISMLGFIMLAGLIVNNGIVLIDYINQARREGMSKHEAIIDAGRTRLRPILMTAMTTILAMFTSAIGIGDGSDMIKPMAIAIIGGLVYGTILTLIVIPCIYDAFNREKSMVEEEL